MAVKKQNNKGLSGEKKTIRLFYDGDRYKDPVYVGINGMSWLIERGVDVEVPIEVAWVLENSMAQDKKTAQMIKELSGAPKDLGNV